VALLVQSPNNLMDAPHIQVIFVDFEPLCPLFVACLIGVKRFSRLCQMLAFLKERAGSDESGIAVIGFSMGAYYALNLSANHPDTIQSVILFYGTGPADFSTSKAAYLGHFADSDPFEPQSSLDDLEGALKLAGRPVTFYQYPNTGHWFFEPDRVDVYNPEASQLAWDRTLAFLSRTMTM